MPRGKSVSVVIAVDGTCSIDALNFTDSSCRSATQEIAAALGHTKQEIEKPESRVRQRTNQGEQERTR